MRFLQDPYTWAEPRTGLPAGRTAHPANAEGTFLRLMISGPPLHTVAHLPYLENRDVAFGFIRLIFFTG